MPIPFLIGAGVAVAAATIVKKNVDKRADLEVANAVNEVSKEMLRNIENDFQVQMLSTQFSVDKLRNRKKKILETSMRDFSDVYKKYKMKDSDGLDELDETLFSSNDVQQLDIAGHKNFLELSISEVLFPSFNLLGSFIQASKAKKARYEALENQVEAKMIVEEGKDKIALMRAIELRTSQMDPVLRKLNKYFKGMLEELNAVVAEAGYDYENYTTYQKEVLYKTRQMAKLVKTMIDTSVIKENGHINEASEEMLANGERVLVVLESEVKA